MYKLLNDLTGKCLLAEKYPFYPRLKKSPAAENTGRAFNGYFAKVENNVFDNNILAAPMKPIPASNHSVFLYKNTKMLLKY